MEIVFKVYTNNNKRSVTQPQFLEAFLENYFEFDTSTPRTVFGRVFRAEPQLPPATGTKDSSLSPREDRATIAAVTTPALPIEIPESIADAFSKATDSPNPPKIPSGNRPDASAEREPAAPAGRNRFLQIIALAYLQIPR